MYINIYIYKHINSDIKYFNKLIINKIILNIVIKI